jgi:hypothetical protein
METNLRIRLRAYATTADAQIPGDTTLYADALASSRAASAAASASIICSHARELPEEPRAGHQHTLPLRPGNDSVAKLVPGAEGVASIKSQNG